MEVLTVPHPMLRQVAKPIGKLTPKVLALIKGMQETLIQRDAAGIAAPQVGELLRVILVRTGYTHCDKLVIEVFLNPEIVEVGDDTVASVEGCLSMPGEFYRIQRHSSVKVKSGNKVDWFSGLSSIVIQHEIDHLDGVLMSDKGVKYTPVEKNILAA